MIMSTLKISLLMTSSIFPWLLTIFSLTTGKSFSIFTKFFLPCWRRTASIPMKMISSFLCSRSRRAEQEKIIQEVFKRNNWKENGSWKWKPHLRGRNREWSWKRRWNPNNFWWRFYLFLIRRWRKLKRMIPSKISLNFFLNLLSISRRKTRFSKRNLKSKVLSCLKFARIWKKHPSEAKRCIINMNVKHSYLTQGFSASLSGTQELNLSGWVCGWDDIYA